MSGKQHRSTKTVRITIPAGPLKQARETTGQGSPPRSHLRIQPNEVGERAGYRQLLESIYDGLLVAHVPSGRIVRVNERALGLFQVERQRLLNMRLPELISGAGESLVAEVAGQTAHKQFAIIEAYCVRRDGTDFPAEIALRPVQSGGDALVYVFVRDITQRLQMERELVRLSKAVESAGDAIAITDEEGRHIYQNEAFLALIGSDEARTLGHRSGFAWLFADPADELRESLNAGTSWTGRADIAPGAASSPVPVLFRVDPIRLDDGRTIGMLAIITDITKQLQTEKQLRQALTDLARSNQELEQLAYVASHDLKEPLRAINGYLNLLQRRHGDSLHEQALDYLNKAIEGADRMRQFIDHILDYARLDRPPEEPRRVQSALLLRQAQDNLKSLIQEHRAVVTSDPLPEIVTVAPRLVQVLQNLLSNAIRYCDNNPPRVHVRAAREHDKWVFYVSDNGIGVDRTLWERVFILFQRLHTQDEYTGSGIGLATCRKIVEQAGGKIWIEDSQPGKGSTIAFSIPVAPPGNTGDRMLKPPPGIISGQ